MNEKKEEQELIEKRVEFLVKLCPVFRTKCKGDECQSYYAGGFNVKGELFSPECNSPLVNGIIYHREIT